MLDMRRNWTIPTESGLADIFYNKEDTIQNVKDNFDFRRMYTPEGYDLIINGVTVRCLVHTANNPMRELNDYRNIHCPMDADVKRGYYVQYEGDTWIIDTNVVNVDGAYQSTRMSRCQYLLNWQNKNGDIIQRWAYCADQTKYSNGQIVNNNITVPDNQYSLLIASDSETKQLKRGMRFVFDFIDVDVPDVYQLTNRKVSLVNGTMELSLTIETFNPEKDFLVTLPDGSQQWVCDFKKCMVEENESTNDGDDTDEVINPEFESHIVGGNTLKCGRRKTWVLESGKLAPYRFNWEVISDFDIDMAENGDEVSLYVDDTEYIGQTFILQAVSVADNLILDRVSVTVVDMM